MRRFFIPILVLMGLCHTAATKAQPTSEADGQAVLFIYRKGAFGNGFFDVWINGRLMVRDFRPRSYFAVKTKPGVLHIRTAGRPDFYITEKNFRIEVQPGQEYYLEAVFDYDFLSGSLYLVQRRPEDFRKRLKGLKLNEKAKTALE